MLKIVLKEARSKSRFLHTTANAFASHILEYLKARPEDIIEKDNITMEPADFVPSEYLSKFKKLKDITIIFTKKPNLQDGIKVSKAVYFHKPMSNTIGDKRYSFKRGEIAVQMLVDDKVKSFADVSPRYQKIYSSLSELFRHEIEHYVDDYASKDGLAAQRKERSPYDFLSDEQKKRFNYLITPAEIKAYVKQFMEIAKRKRIPFKKVLIDYAFKSKTFSAFNEDPKLKNILYVIIYKYLEYASTVYNSVRDDKESMAYLKKLGEYLQNKNLYPLEDT